MNDDDKTVFKPQTIVSADGDDDRTLLVAPRRDSLEVEYVDLSGRVVQRFQFFGGFKVGRTADNEIVIQHDTVSRHHLEIKPTADGWWLYNLNSTNGIFIDERLIQGGEKLQLPVRVAIGKSGIGLNLRSQAALSEMPQPKPAPIAAAPAAQQPSLHAAQTVFQPAAESPTAGVQPKHRILSQEELQNRLLAAEDSDDMGDYTLMVRRVIKQDQVKRGKSYRKAIWVLGLLVVLVSGLFAYQQIALSNTRKIALEMFYDIKTLEVNLAQADLKLEEHAEVLDRALQAMSDEKLRASQEQLRLQQEKIAEEKRRMQQDRERLANMKAKYRQYVEEANSLRLSFPTAAHYENELIAKVARELGESELELPEPFVAEVRKYIGYWQASSRLPKAIDNLERQNLLPIIAEHLQKQGLPLYFVYLPLQESNFDIQAVGPETRFGIAKGAWQLLAATAQQYGVLPGPLAATREFDQQDGRFDFAQATQAGTRYLKHIYSTEAQASGLLVMASYNYGDNRVKNMIAQMPDNPRDRNFWKFLQQYELPAETRDYVFYIFSAAVIGEDPQHFGFKFGPPLYKAKS